MYRKHINVNRFIFTGAPGSGKTSAIQELEKSGYVVVTESATDVIHREQAKGILCPWEQQNFVDMIVLEQKALQMNTEGELQFYDRSPFCSYALGRYLSRWLGNDFKPSSVLMDEIDRCLVASVYQDKVFFFENLGFIEHTDARKISYEDALIFERIHLDVYQEFGFDIVFVPKNSTQKRCELILESVA